MLRLVVVFVSSASWVRNDAYVGNDAYGGNDGYVGKDTARLIENQINAKTICLINIIFQNSA